MTSWDRAAPKPGRFGLTGDRAQEQLVAAGWWNATGPVEASVPILFALSRVPDPDAALLSIERMREADEARWDELNSALHTDVGLRARLLAILGGSTTLSDFLVSNPGTWRGLIEPARAGVESYTARLREALRDEGSLLQGKDAVRGLRQGYRGLLVEIAAADLAFLVEPDLGQPSYTEVTTWLTELAEAVLRVALDVAWLECGGDDESTRLAVVAMGKTGGRELNYVSDVDIIFVGEGDNALATRVASGMMRLVGASCFEVDAALRPEGKAGALVRTIDSHAAYYKKWARTWEFQALLKARPVAGDTELGAQYAEIVTPLVWSAAERENFVVDVQSMRRKVENHVPADIADRELKLGRGGLRDVEFAVQLLQLVHGRADPELRSASTMEALEALGSGGYVGRSDVAELESAYRFLRTLEHRLQLHRLRRTHLFPDADDVDELRWLARSIGLKPQRGRSAGEVLLGEFRKKMQAVRRLHEKLFYRPLLESVARVPTEALRLTTDEAKRRLAALGYTAPDGALNHIKALTSGMSRRASIQQTLLPVLLDRFADTPDPDGGLLAYRKVSEALAETPWYLRVLRDEGAVVDNLATVLGTSKLIPELLMRAPEVLRLLGKPAELTGKDPDEVAVSLCKAVARHTFVHSAVPTARSLRRHEMLRVACADLLGLMPVPEVCAALSSVWAAVLQATLDVAQRRKGEDVARMAVIGMGRLGGSELGYGSDADVLFVCEPCEGISEGEAVRYATEVASMVSRLLGSPSQDPPLTVDADLRPEGRQGPLVRTLESYRAYYQRWGEVWETQALLRARPVAGDSDLCARFVAMIDPVRYPDGGISATQAREVRRIKARVDTERLPRGADPRTNTKLGTGGLGDVEWTAQLLQLLHAHEVSALRTTSTLGALAALAESGLVEQADVDALTEAWLLATKVRNAATLVRGKPVDQIPTSGKELVAVASILGHEADEDPGEFLDAYRRTARRARAVVDRLFYDV